MPTNPDEPMSDERLAELNEFRHMAEKGYAAWTNDNAIELLNEVKRLRADENIIVVGDGLRVGPSMVESYLKEKHEALERAEKAEAEIEQLISTHPLAYVYERAEKAEAKLANYRTGYYLLGLNPLDAAARNNKYKTIEAERDKLRAFAQETESTDTCNKRWMTFLLHRHGLITRGGQPTTLLTGKEEKDGA